MNILEALNVALPELPAKAVRKGAPRLDSRVSARKHFEGGAVTVYAHVPGSGEFFRFSPDQWALIELFDGQRSYQEIADAYFEQAGISVTEDWVRSYATDLEFTGFWYKAPQERNIEVMRKVAEARHFQIAKFLNVGNLADIRFPAWDPDRYLARVERILNFVYSPWFTALTLALFAFVIFVFIDRWSEIGADTLEFYNFTDKSFADVAEFWVLFFVLVFCHETAHGVTTKHFGAGVHQMGFNLIYLSPCFYVDISELWVYATRWQRVAAMVAGLWLELIFCGVATIVWWATAPGTGAHDFAYKVMLLTGIGSVLISLNPLIKLDGYYILTEILRIPELKEQSTALVMSWVKKNIFRLPVTVGYVPHRRKWIYAPYAILSSVYSYLLLFVVIRFARNIFRGYSPEWAFVPALLLAYFIFRSRLRALVRFMKIAYLDKRELLFQARNSRWLIGAALVSLLFLFAPIWRVTVEGRFLLEPTQHAVIRAHVPGEVERVWAVEGQPVSKGAPLAQLRNLNLATEAEKALADLTVATSRSTQAQLRSSGYGSAAYEEQKLAERNHILNDERNQLLLVTPIAGVVVTPRPGDLLGSYIPAGAEVAEVADLSSMKARIYVSETDVLRVQAGADAQIYVDALLRSIPGEVLAVGPASSDGDESVVPKQKYLGMSPPHYYTATLVLPNPDGTLRPGLSGTARIYASGQRRSLAVLAWQYLREFADRKMW